MFRGKPQLAEFESATKQAQGKSCQDELLREAGYFEHNQHRMDYLEMPIQGWVIGSGRVESAPKQFKAHLAGPGMHWSRGRKASPYSQCDFEWPFPPSVALCPKLARNLRCTPGNGCASIFREIVSLIKSPAEFELSPGVVLGVFRFGGRNWGW